LKFRKPTKSKEIAMLGYMSTTPKKKKKKVKKPKGY